MMDLIYRRISEAGIPVADEWAEWRAARGIHLEDVVQSTLHRALRGQDAALLKIMCDSLEHSSLADPSTSLQGTILALATAAPTTGLSPIATNTILLASLLRVMQRLCCLDAETWLTSMAPTALVDIVGRVAAGVGAKGSAGIEGHLRKSLEDVVEAAVGAVCDVLEALPGRNELVKAAHDLQAFLFTNLLSQDPELSACRPLAFAGSMIDLALGIIAADTGSGADRKDRKWSTRSGILLAFCGTRMVDPAGYSEVLGEIGRMRPCMLRALAEAIAAHAAFRAVDEPASMTVDALQYHLIDAAFHELIYMSVKSSRGLRRQLVRTPAAGIYAAIARVQLIKGSSSCQHDLNSALIIASSRMPDDRVLNLINDGVLEVFVRAHVAGNSHPSGPLQPARATSLVASPQAGCAARIANLAQRPSLRPIITPRLAPLLGPMLHGLERDARSHDYDMHDDVVELARKLDLPDPSVRPLRCAIADCTAVEVKACAKCRFVCFCSRAHQLEAWPQHRISCKFLAI